MDKNIANLLSCPWDLISVNDTEPWLLKFSCQNAEYQIGLTNLSTVFIETMDGLDIQERCNALNRRLEAPSDSVVNHIHKTVLQRHNHKFVCTQESSCVNLSFSNFLESEIPFQWKFICKKHSDNLTRKFLFNPMVLAVSRLLCENDKLKETIKKKDDEIKDYRDSGYKVSRPYLKTDTFDQSIFDAQLEQSRDYAMSLTKDYASVVTSKRVNDLLIRVSTDSCSTEISQLANSPSTVKEANMHSSVSVSNSPLKRKNIRKTRPHVRGCVLNSVDDASDNDTSTLKSVEDTKEPVITKEKKPKKMRRKPLF